MIKTRRYEDCITVETFRRYRGWPQAAKALGGRWNGEVWTFPNSAWTEGDLRADLVYFFGTDGLRHRSARRRLVTSIR